MSNLDTPYTPHYYDRESDTGLAVPSILSIRTLLCHSFKTSVDRIKCPWGTHCNYAIKVGLFDQEKWETLEWYEYDYNDITTPLVDVTAKVTLAPLSEEGDPQWNSPLAESFNVSFYDNGEDMVYVAFNVDAKAYDHVKLIMEELLDLFEIERATEYYTLSMSHIEIYVPSEGDSSRASVQVTLPFYCKSRAARDLDKTARYIMHAVELDEAEK